MVWVLMKRKLCVCVLRLCLTELEHKSEDICIWRFFLSSHCCYIYVSSCRFSIPASSLVCVLHFTLKDEPFVLLLLLFPFFIFTFPYVFRINFRE